MAVKFRNLHSVRQFDERYEVISPTLEKIRQNDGPTLDSHLISGFHEKIRLKQILLKKYYIPKAI